MNSKIMNKLVLLKKSLDLLIKKKKITQKEYVLLKKFFVKKNSKIIFSIISFKIKNELNQFVTKKDIIQILITKKSILLKKYKEVINKISNYKKIKSSSANENQVYENQSILSMIRFKDNFRMKKSDINLLDFEIVLKEIK